MSNSNACSKSRSGSRSGSRRGQCSKSQSGSGSGSGKKQVENRQCGQLYYNLPLLPTVTERLALYRFIRNANFDDFQPCKDLRNVAFSHLIGGQQSRRQSASQSLQIAAKYMSDKFGNGKRDFMYKISFEPRPRVRDNSLAAERKIYEKVTNRLILQRNTPFIVAYYGHFVGKCGANEAIGKLTTANEKLAYANFLTQIGATRRYNMNKMNVLMTERAFGQQVKKINFEQLSKSENGEAMLLEILFQVVWTLLCFRDVGLSHNDLHTNNVFVNMRKEPQRNLFVLDKNHVYSMESFLITQIFDFDYGSKVPTEYDSCKIENTKLDRLCSQYGFCNDYDERRDICRFLTLLLEQPGSDNTFVGDVIEKLEIVDLEFIYNFMWASNIDRVPGYAAWPGAICQVMHSAPTKCRTFPQLKKKVASLEVMLAKIANRLIELGVMEQFVITDDSGDICKDQAAYVLPSQMEAVGIPKCSQKVAMFGQDRRWK